MRYIFSAALISCCLLLISSNGFTRISAYEFESQQQEEDYKSLTEELRCLVCQNQNIAGSNAELAQDLKRKTYELVVAGKSKEEIADYMIERYGDFVLYRPPLRTETVILWVGPFVIFFIGVFFLIRVIRARTKQVSADLSAEDQAKAEELLKGE